jgi:hypothetical protein
MGGPWRNRLLTPDWFAIQTDLVTETSAEELLADVRTLRRRTRRDRRASAFPLLLFGLLILLAPLCYAPRELPPPDPSMPAYSFTTVDFGPFPMFIGYFLEPKYPGLVGWYWFLIIVLGFVATAWWYRKRALRIGVETDSRGYLVAAGAALAGFLVGQPLLEYFVRVRGTLYSTPDVNLPIMIVSAVVAAPVLYWATRRSRGRVERAIGVFVGMVLATVAFSALGIYMIYGFSGLLVIAAALLAMAWLERSVLLGIIGLAFGGASLLANLYDSGDLFWSTGSQQEYVLQLLILPAAVLIVGGIVVGLAGLGARR